jgi:hypothetical protein
LQKRADAGLKRRIIGGRWQQDADSSHLFALLRTHNERPHDCPAK